MESGQLVGQELADRQESQRSDAQQVTRLAGVRVAGRSVLVHDGGHLTVLVSVDVDSPVDGQRRQLFLLDVDDRSGTGARTLGQVLRAVDGLVFQKDAAFLDGAAEVVDGRAAQLETLDAGAVAVAVKTSLKETQFEGRVDVHQSSVDHFENVLVPKGAVQMDPAVHVEIDQPGRTVRDAIAFQAAKEALTFVQRFVTRRRTDADGRPIQHFRQFLVGHLFQVGQLLFSGQLLLETGRPRSVTDSLPFGRGWSRVGWS